MLVKQCELYSVTSKLTNLWRNFSKTLRYANPARRIRIFSLRPKYSHWCRTCLLSQSPRKIRLFKWQRLITKIWDWAKYHNRHSSKSIKVTNLSFCQNDPPMSTSFWKKKRLVTLILFELCLLWYLAQSQILVISL